MPNVLAYRVLARAMEWLFDEWSFFGATLWQYHATFAVNSAAESGPPFVNLADLAGSPASRVRGANAEIAFALSLVVRHFRQLAAINQPIGGGNNAYHS